MNIIMKQQLQDSIKDFRLPRFAEITDVGLYLDQMARYVNTYLNAVGCAEITPSMVSNYVKQKIVPGPAKKTYGAASIAHLVFIAFVKNVMSMDDIRMLEALREKTYSIPAAYDYFCAEFENVLHLVFGLKETLDEVGSTDTEAKSILRAAILASAQKIHLDSYLRMLRQAEGLF